MVINGINDGFRTIIYGISWWWTMGIDWGIFREFREMMGLIQSPSYFSQLLRLVPSMWNFPTQPWFRWGCSILGDGIITKSWDLTVIGNFMGVYFMGSGWANISWWFTVGFLGSFLLKLGDPCSFGPVTKKGRFSWGFGPWDFTIKPSTMGWCFSWLQGCDIESGFDQSNATKRPTRMGSLYILYTYTYIYIYITAKITVHKSPMNHELL